MLVVDPDIAKLFVLKLGKTLIKMFQQKQIVIPPTALFERLLELFNIFRVFKCFVIIFFIVNRQCGYSLSHPHKTNYFARNKDN